MPLLGFPGAQYPYIHAQYLNVGPGAMIGNGGGPTTLTAEPNRPLPAGSRFDPLLGVVPVPMGGGGPNRGWMGDERFGGHGQGYGVSYSQQLHLAYSQPPGSPSAPAAPMLSPSRSKDRDAIVTSPKRRRPPASDTFADHDNDGDAKLRRSNEGTKKKEDAHASPSSTPVKLTRDHYAILVEHHANLVNEIQETELMMSVYEQQLKLASNAPGGATHPDETGSTCDPNSAKRPLKREVDVEPRSKKKRG